MHLLKWYFVHIDSLFTKGEILILYVSFLLYF